MADRFRPIRVPPDIEARYNLPGAARSANSAVPGGSATQTVTGVTINRFPPEIYPISDARGFTLFDQVDTVGVNTTYTPAGLKLDLPDGYTAVIRSITLDMNDISATTDVRYAIRVNGAAVPGYDSLRHFPRVAASVSKDFDSFIVVPDGQVIDVLITNVDGGARKVGAQLVGWQWATASGRRWMGEG